MGRCLSAWSTGKFKSSAETTPSTGTSTGWCQIQLGSFNPTKLFSPAIITIGTDPVCCLLPTSGALYTASGQKILMLDAWANTVIRSFVANGEQSGGGEGASISGTEGSIMSLKNQAASAASSMVNMASMVSHMAVCGIGLWVALNHSSTVSLYHTESFIHMQDINIASNVSRALGGSSKRSIYVTALSAAKGLLWVCTNPCVTFC